MGDISRIRDCLERRRKPRVMLLRSESEFEFEFEFVADSLRIDWNVSDEDGMLRSEPGMVCSKAVGLGEFSRSRDSYVISGVSGVCCSGREELGA